MKHVCNAVDPEECTLPDHAQAMAQLAVVNRCEAVNGETGQDGERCGRVGGLVRIVSPLATLEARLCDIHQTMYKRRHFEIQVIG